MSQASQLSPEVAQGVLELARTLVAAAQSWTLYPPEHPNVEQSLARFADAVGRASPGGVFSMGIAPDTLLVDGIAANPELPAIAQAASLLHDRDLLRLAFVGDVAPAALRSLLQVLALDPDERRQRGGPAAIWTAQGHSSIVLEQVDYKSVLEREAGDPSDHQDDLWRAIVKSAATPRAVFDEQAQQRLLEIAGNAAAVGQLARAVMEPLRASDGSPMITLQAAAVLTAFRHLTSVVTVTAPDRLPAAADNLAAAAVDLDPHVTLQLLQADEDAHAPIAVLPGMRAAFDDAKVAQLLATALALDGHASDQLAATFTTIAPDAERRQRVLRLTRNLLSESDFGRGGEFQGLWASMEELLISYNDRPFVSDAYRTALERVGSRAERLAAGELPAELPEWLAGIDEASVRALSVTLLVDLLGLERDEGRIDALADDLEAVAEDLLMAGAHADAGRVAEALQRRATPARAPGAEACRRALDRLAGSAALRETAALLATLDEGEWASVRAVLTALGAASLQALLPALEAEHDTLGLRRAGDTVVGFGARVVNDLAPLVNDARWFVQCTGARLLGRIGSPDAVPLLQPLLRSGDPRVVRTALRALSSIDSPSAGRAVHGALRAATAHGRRAVVEALVADRDPRVVPILARILDESEALGKDHDVVLDTIAAVGTVGAGGGDAAVAAVVRLMRQRGVFRRRRRRALKRASVDALRRVGTPAAGSALEDAAETGDRLLKRILAGR